MLPLGDGSNGSVLYHCSNTVQFTGRGKSAPLQRLVFTTNRTHVARTSLGNGNLTRETQITATSSRVSVISVSRVLQTSSLWSSGTRSPIRHKLVTLSLRFSNVRCCSCSTRTKTDRDEKSDERVTNWAFDIARCRSQ